MSKPIFPILLICIVMLSCGGGSSQNNNPPAYIKDVVCYEEGMDTWVIYFILADANGEMTSANGIAALSIKSGEDSEDLLYSESADVTEDSFYKTTAGSGAWERDVTIYAFGGIPSSEFWREPTSHSGEVLIEFYYGVEIFKGIGSISFD